MKKYKKKWIKPDFEKLSLKATSTKTEEVPPVIEGRKGEIYTIGS